MTLSNPKQTAYGWVALYAATAGTVAVAQSRGAGVEESARPSTSDTPLIAALPLRNWNYEGVYEGWYADGVVDRPIYGPHGDEIGNVKNLLMNPRGQVVALITEVGGFLDIGDTHVRIPWVS